MALGVAKRSLVVTSADKKKSASSRRTSKKSTTKKVATKKLAAIKKTTKSVAKKSTTKKPAVKKTTSPKKTEKTTKKTATKKTPAKKTPATKKVSTAPAKKSAAKKPNVKKTEFNQKINSTLEKVSPKHPIAAEGQNNTFLRRDPLGHLLIEQMLRAEGFMGVVSTDKALLAEYSTDESIFSVRPQLVLQPYTTNDITVATKIVARETGKFKSLSLTPRGAGAGFTGGSLSDSVIVDMRSYLNKVGAVEYVTNDAVTITVQAGARWVDMEKALKKVGYYVPAYPHSRKSATVGGAVSNNAFGPEYAIHGSCGDWVERLELVLADGELYSITPLTYKEAQKIAKKDNALGRIVSQLLSLLATEEKDLQSSKPAVFSNSGYNLWDALPQGYKAFKKNKGTLDLPKLFAGSQGTIGIIATVTMRALPISKTETVVCAPVHDLSDLKNILEYLKNNDIKKIEAFDKNTFDFALQNPEAFSAEFTGLSYYRTVLSMYTTYHVRFRKKLPELFLFITLDTADSAISTHQIMTDLKQYNCQAYSPSNPNEIAMLQFIVHSGFQLAKRLDVALRPAPFLEDMIIPERTFAKFYTNVTALLHSLKIKYFVYSHPLEGRIHFYPLLNFSKKDTGLIIEKLSNEYYELAVANGGIFSAQNNDGIIRTPNLEKLYSKKLVQLFESCEAIFDPQDIFNPGKKVNPQYDVKNILRQYNF